MSKADEGGSGSKPPENPTDLGAEIDEVMVPGARPDFENWNQAGILGDEENEEAMQYFAKSLVQKKRNNAEDEKENDMNKLT